MNHNQGLYPVELVIAITAARLASKVIQDVSQTNFKVEHKSQHQPVTIADTKANEIIKNTILGSFPEDGWLSEESTDNTDRLTNKRVWIVDPLDGTKEFIAKVPEYAVSIGLAINGKPVVGVIINPSTGEEFWATQKGGAFLNGQPIHVSTGSQLNNSRILASRSELKRDDWKPFENKFHIIPSGGLAFKITEVACGRADASFTLSPKSEWDLAGGAIILTEAGGRMSLPDGTEVTLNKKEPRVPGLVYSNSLLHGDLIEFLGQTHRSAPTL